MLDRDCHRGITVKRNMPRDHLIHRNARGVYVALLVHDSAPRLLRRSVVHRSHHVGADRVRRSRRPRDPEIRHLYFSVFGNDDILRLDIPVNDMLIVRRLNSGHHLDRDTDRLFRGKLSFLLYIIFQRNTLHKFHDHIVKPAILPHIIDIDHIRMHQSCRRLRFAQKLLDKYFIGTIIAL